MATMFLPISMDVSWHLPVRLAGIEQIGRLWPGWERLFAPDGKRRVAGDADVVLDGMYSSHPRDRVMRYAMELNADGRGRPMG